MFSIKSEEDIMIKNEVNISIVHNKTTVEALKKSSDINIPVIHLR